MLSASDAPSEEKPAIPAPTEGGIATPAATAEELATPAATEEEAATPTPAPTAVLPKVCSVTYQVDGNSPAIQGKYDVRPGESADIPLTVPDSITPGRDAGNRTSSWNTTVGMKIEPGDTLTLSGHYADGTLYYPSLKIIVDGKTAAVSHGEPIITAHCDAQGCGD
jgi:hypothetical protein